MYYPRIKLKQQQIINPKTRGIVITGMTPIDTLPLKGPLDKGF